MPTIQHALILVKVGIDYFVPDVPGAVLTRIRRLQHEQRRASERYQLELVELRQKRLGQKTEI